LAFTQTLHQIRRRLELFINLPQSSLRGMALQEQARALARS